MRLNRMVRVLPCALLLCCAAAWAQQISGSIMGAVKDSQQAVIVGAKVTLTNQAQGTSREISTAVDGAFVFTPVQPGAYTLTVEATGFKKFEQKDLRLSANERVNVGDVLLAVGQLTETVTVEASAAVVQTASAERSGLLTNRQVNDLGMLTRDIFSLARTVPGIVVTGGGVGGLTANGTRPMQNNFTLDGVTNMDTGSNGGILATTNPDMIAEFKLITNSQQAEFGRSSGAQIMGVTKAGTQAFHGTGYLFHRHEDLNANTWRNNIDGRERPFYRYNFAGYNVGGPVYIPGKFNRNKDKLFFFVGMEWQNQFVPNGLRNVTVPTDLERQGDFSQSHERGGAAVKIIDPLNGQPFSEMKIPASRINSDGQKILNWYPKPNALGISPDYNYQSQVSDTYPRREYVYRGDYQINDTWRAYARFIKTYSQTNKNYGQWNASYNIPFSQMNFGDPGWSFISNITTIINPTLTNEFIFGSSKNVLNIDPVDDTFARSKLNLSYQMPFPDADTLQLVQNWNWGGVPNGPTSNFNGTPFRNFNHTYDITDNVAKVHGTHTLKAGIYTQKSLKDQTAFTSVNGTIWFDRDSSNPGDTNWAWSNALIGTFRQLRQSNVVLNGQYRYWNIEWFVQDSWRATQNVTLEYGLRFYYIQPQYDRALQTSAFNPSLYDFGSAGVLMRPGLENGKKVAVNPLTGATGPAALIGSLVNTGKGFVDGIYANGMGLAGKDGYPRALINGSGIHYAPRLGIAYQFLPKTVLRLGAGMFYDRMQGNPVFDMLPNPPSTNQPEFWYGNLASIPPAAQGTYFPPSNINGFDIHGQIPTTYNWNITIQRELPQAILFDIGYVGSSSSHMVYRYNANAIPLGSAWLPENQDPTNLNPKYDGSTTIASNFYRPYQGYGGTTIIGFGANSNYNSLQMSANKRFGEGLTFGVAYTWSKVMGTTNDDYTTNIPFNIRVADYGPLPFDRTHNLGFNYLWSLPKLVKGDSAGAKVLGYIANNWQISGITTLMTGAPNNIGYSIEGVSSLNERMTGSPDVGSRVVYTSSPSYPKSVDQWVTAGLKPPDYKSSQGFDSSIRPVRNPGDNNWDVSIFKNLPLGAESRFIQLRVEMFNAPNHTRFNAFNNSVTFNQQGQVTNLPAALGGKGGRFGFGALTGTADPRRIQLAAKIYF